MPIMVSSSTHGVICSCCYSNKSDIILPVMEPVLRHLIMPNFLVMVWDSEGGE